MVDGVGELSSTNFRHSPPQDLGSTPRATNDKLAPKTKKKFG